jgi:hypothetical protein
MYSTIPKIHHNLLTNRTESIKITNPLAHTVSPSNSARFVLTKPHISVHNNTRCTASHTVGRVPCSKSLYQRLATGWKVWESSPDGGEARFSAPDQNGPGAHPAYYKKGIGSLQGVKGPGRGADHPPQLAPKLIANLKCPSNQHSKHMLHV